MRKIRKWKIFPFIREKNWLRNIWKKKKKQVKLQNQKKFSKNKLILRFGSKESKDEFNIYQFEKLNPISFIVICWIAEMGIHGDWNEAIIEIERRSNQTLNWGKARLKYRSGYLDYLNYIFFSPLNEFNSTNITSMFSIFLTLIEYLYFIFCGFIFKTSLFDIEKFIWYQLLFWEFRKKYGNIIISWSLFEYFHDSIDRFSRIVLEISKCIRDNVKSLLSLCYQKAKIYSDLVPKNWTYLPQPIKIYLP